MSSTDKAANIVLLSLSDKLLEKRMRTVDLFRQIDESGDGVVSPDEFQDGLEKFGFSPSKNEFIALMQLLDRDGDGEVDFREFDKAMKKAVKDEGSEARSKRLAADLAIEPAEGAVSDGYLQTLMEKAQKTSHFFRDFTKNELRTILKASTGTINFGANQTILPPDIKTKWLGLILQGTVEVRNKTNPDEIIAKYGIGTLPRVQQFLREYHQVCVGKSSKPSKGVLRLNVDRKGQQQPVRMGTSVIGETPGAVNEYIVGATPDGIMLCWGYSSLDIMREADATKDVAYKFLEKLSSAASSEYLERVNQIVFAERLAAADVSGAKEAAKVAQLNKKMKEMEAEKIKIDEMMKKAKDAVHKAKNDAVMRKGLERKLAETEEKLKVAVKKSGGKDGKDGAGGDGKKGGSKSEKEVVAKMKKMKKSLAEAQNNSKRKLESLRKMLTDQTKKKLQQAEKGAQKKLDAKLKALREKLKKEHDAKMAEMKLRCAEMAKRLEELEGSGKQAEEAAAAQAVAAAAEEEAKSEQKAAAEAEAKQEEIEQKKKEKGKRGWSMLKKKHNEESEKRRKAREQFANIMQQAHKNNLREIKNEALAQLETTRLLLLQEQNEKKSYEDMLRNAREAQERMSQQTNDLMRRMEEQSLADAAEREKLRKKTDQETFEREKKFENDLAAMTKKLKDVQLMRDSFERKLEDEILVRSTRDDEILSLESDLEAKGWAIEELNDENESRRLFAIMLALRLGIEQRRLIAALRRMTIDRDDWIGVVAERDASLAGLNQQLSSAHGTIVLHVKSNEQLQERIALLNAWCKKSHQHRLRLERLTMRFEEEMEVARDAIYSQSLRNEELQVNLTQLSSDQVNASEVRATMLHRLQVSEMRRVELEKRFSTLARASTPLMEEIRAVEKHGNRLLVSNSDEERGEGDEGDEEDDEEDYSDDQSSGGSWLSGGGGGGGGMSPWISPYLRRRRRNENSGGGGGGGGRGRGGGGDYGSPRIALDMTKNTKRQQKTLVTIDEQELLDPSSNRLLFLGANKNTNVMAVMLLEQRGYSVRTVTNFQELAHLSAKEGMEELAYSIDLVVVDLNAMRLSVELVMRMLGGPEMLGEQMSSRDVSCLLLLCCCLMVLSVV